MHVHILRPLEQWGIGTGLCCCKGFLAIRLRVNAEEKEYDALLFHFARPILSQHPSRISA